MMQGKSGHAASASASLVLSEDGEERLEDFERGTGAVHARRTSAVQSSPVTRRNMEE